MRRPLQSGIPARAIAFGLVLLAHVLLFLLVLFHSPSPPQTDTELIQFVSLWPDLKPPTPEPEIVNLPPPESPSRAGITPPAPDITPSEVPEPDEDISTAITPSPLPPIDWQREGIAAAKRAAQPKEPATFTAPPKTVRRPCEPPESSFVWNPEMPRAGFTSGPIPLPFVMLGKRCVVGLGFFGCNLGELPKANSHLFDDLEGGKTMKSSVPDAKICD